MGDNEEGEFFINAKLVTERSTERFIVVKLEVSLASDDAPRIVKDTMGRKLNVETGSWYHEQNRFPLGR